MSITVGDDVVSRAQRGDERAFAEIVRAYQAPILSFVRRLVRDRETAEDVTQDVFLRVYRNLPQLESAERLTAWMYGIAHNRALDELRSRTRRPAPVELDPEVERGADDPPLDRAETLAAVWHAVAQLGPDLKTALLLRDVAGLSYAEIADAVHVPVST